MITNFFAATPGVTNKAPYNSGILIHGNQIQRCNFS